MRGRLITLEGGEGAGKSSILPTISNYLNCRGIDVLSTREPGGTSLGENLRDVLLNTDQKIVPNAEVLMMFAARAQHIEEVIEPALKRGCWVLCDRFIDSSYAYQGGGRELGADRVRGLEHWLMKDMSIDLTLLLDVTREVSLKRTRTKSAPNRIELEGDRFFERVRQTYLDRAKSDPDRVKVIDATAKLAMVAKEVCSQLDKSIAQWLPEEAAV